MPHDIVAVEPRGDHRLFVRFDDGAEGVLDLSAVLRFDGVFAPLRDPNAFASVSLDPELGTIAWPGGADLCPDVLWSLLTGQAVPAARVREKV